MTNSEFYNAVNKVVRDSVAALNFAQDEIADLEVDLSKNRNKFNPEYIREHYHMRTDSLRLEMQRIKERAEMQIDEICEKFRPFAENADRLDPKKLTEDVELLKLGVKLSPNELDAIFDRNANNTTMQKLIMMYAQQNDIKFNRSYTYPEEAALSALKGTRDISKVILKHYQSTDLYDRMMGENSPYKAALSDGQ